MPTLVNPLSTIAAVLAFTFSLTSLAVFLTLWMNTNRYAAGLVLASAPSVFLSGLVFPMENFAAWALRLASVRTSLATTANPRPCSPARAASTAAFSARIFVWKAILLMTAVISEIFFELVEIAPIVFTTPETVCPPSLRGPTSIKPLPHAATA